MIRIPLTTGWTVTAFAGPVPEALPSDIPAMVPGTVHTDLLAAGLIPDPYLDRNEQLLRWIGESDFRYRTSFEWVDADVEHERVDLVAEGLDTVSTLRLNGSQLGETKNQHRSYRFDVRDLLQDGSNQLEVDFHSALVFAREAEKRIGAKPFVGNDLPYNAIRKMACNFGWDWGPVLTTAGIWKPIYLHRWSVARIAQVVPIVLVSSSVGTVEVRIELERTGDHELTAEVRLTGPGGVDLRSTTVVEGSSAILALDVENPELWWPRGYGEQPLYRLDVQVSNEGKPLDDWSHEIGFRTVEVKVEPDMFGTSFEFHVNGQYVYVKGANWIPDDCFLPRITRQDYERGVRDAVEADMNLLRVWGGGIYESDDLYDFCNREGILVWQDFLFACAAYSEAAELWDEVEAEARENVARLAAHPSLVFWNGSNENIEGYYNWGWKDAMEEGESWGRGYYKDLLPRVLAEVDPTRAYLPSSPYSPQNESTPRDPNHGPVHSWEVWNRKDYATYREDIPRFVAEFGYQAPPNFATLSRAVHDDPMLADSPGVLWHQKAGDGNEKLITGLTPHLPQPVTFDDWHFGTQLNQARAITYGIEHFRSHSPRTAGSIIWQLNDCWPVTSWAAVDGDGRRKPLWYALKAVNAPRLLMIQPRDDALALIASNDTAEPWAETVTVRRMDLDGVERESSAIRLDVAPRSNLTVALDVQLVASEDPTTELLVASSTWSRRAFWYFVEDPELQLPEPGFTIAGERLAGGLAVTVTATAFLKDLIVNADRLHPDATVDEMLVTLLPGESQRFVISSDHPLDEHAFHASGVLQSVNSLASQHAVHSA